MRTLTSIVSLAALVALSGCGPNEKKAGAEPVGAAQAEPVGNAMSSTAQDSIGNMGFGPSGAAFGGGSCTLTVEGDETDVDQDGVLDSASVSFTNCTSEERAGTANASYSVTDDLVESGAATLPFNFTVTGHWDYSVTDGQGTSGSIAVDRTVSGRQTASSIGASDAGSVAADLEFPNASFSSDEMYDWDADYTQTGANFGDGTLILSGIWDLEMEAQEGDNEASVYADATVSTPGAGLVLDSTCPTHVVGGSLAATYDISAAHNEDEGTYSATLNVTWTGCGQHSTTYSDNVGEPNG